MMTLNICKKALQACGILCVFFLCPTQTKAVSGPQRCLQLVADFEIPEGQRNKARHWVSMWGSESAYRLFTLAKHIGVRSENLMRYFEFFVKQDRFWNGFGMVPKDCAIALSRRVCERYSAMQSSSLYSLRLNSSIFQSEFRVYEASLARRLVGVGKDAQIFSMTIPAAEIEKVSDGLHAQKNSKDPRLGAVHSPESFAFLRFYLADEGQRIRVRVVEIQSDIYSRLSSTKKSKYKEWPQVLVKAFEEFLRRLDFEKPIDVEIFNGGYQTERWDGKYDEYPGDAPFSLSAASKIYDETCSDLNYQMVNQTPALLSPETGSKGRSLYVHTVWKKTVTDPTQFDPVFSSKMQAKKVELLDPVWTKDFTEVLDRYILAEYNVHHDVAYIKGRETWTPEKWNQLINYLIRKYSRQRTFEIMETLFDYYHDEMEFDRALMTRIKELAQEAGSHRFDHRDVLQHSNARS